MKTSNTVKSTTSGAALSSRVREEKLEKGRNILSDFAEKGIALIQEAALVRVRSSHFMGTAPSDREGNPYDPFYKAHIGLTTTVTYDNDLARTADLYNYMYARAPMYVEIRCNNKGSASHLLNLSFSYPYNPEPKSVDNNTTSYPVNSLQDIQDFFRARGGGFQIALIHARNSLIKATREQADSARQDENSHSRKYAYLMDGVANELQHYQQRALRVKNKRTKGD